MSREQLAAEALATGQAAQHNMRWMKKYPERYDASKRNEMEAYLHMLNRFSKEEMKNARRLGRTSLRNRLKCLVLSIISQPPASKEEVGA